MFRQALWQLSALNSAAFWAGQRSFVTRAESKTVNAGIVGIIGKDGVASPFARRAQGLEYRGYDLPALPRSIVAE